MNLYSAAKKTTYAIKDSNDDFSAIQNKEVSALVRASAAISLAKNGWDTYVLARDQVRGLLAFTVAIKADDPIYDVVQRWILDNMKPKSKKALKIRSGRYRPPRDPFDDDALALEDYDEVVSEPPTSSTPSSNVASVSQHLAFEYDGSREQHIRIRGHKVNVRIITEELSGPERMESVATSYMRPRTRIVFTSYSRAGIEAVQAQLSEIADAYFTVNRVPSFYINSGYGHWRTREYPARPLKSVILKDGQKENLVRDIELFLASESRYRALGLPWHRGYLLSGPPGTGKTSIVKALASHFGKDLYFMSMSSLGGDSPNATFLRLTGDIQESGWLLLEDIDTVQGTHKRDLEDTKRDVPSPEAPAPRDDVSLETLLNFLDGVVTPHGLVTFMTTNRVGAIDGALLRPGRSDMTVTVEKAEADQVIRLYEMAFQTAFPYALAQHNSAGEVITVAPSVVTEALKQTINDPHDAAVTIKTLWETFEQGKIISA